MTVSDLGTLTLLLLPAMLMSVLILWTFAAGGWKSRLVYVTNHTRLITLSRSMLTASWATQPKYFGTKLDVNGCTWCTDINHAYRISQDLAKNEGPMIIWRIPNSSGIPIAWVTVDYQEWSCQSRKIHGVRSLPSPVDLSTVRTLATRLETLGRQRRSGHLQSVKNGKVS